MKKNIEIDNKIKKRLKLILSTKPDKYWVDIIGTTRSNVWGWKNNQFPSSNYLIKILEISDVSADWLFFGIGEKYRHKISTDNKHDSSIDPRERAELSDFISKIELEKMEIEEHLKKIKATKWIADIIKNGDDVKNEKIIPEILKNLILPAIEKVEKNSDTLFNNCKKWLETDDGKETLQKFFKIFL